MGRICRANEVPSDFWKGLYQITDTTKTAAGASGSGEFICPGLKTLTVNDLCVQMKKLSAIWCRFILLIQNDSSWSGSHVQTHFSKCRLTPCDVIWDTTRVLTVKGWEKAITHVWPYTPFSSSSSTCFCSAIGADDFPPIAREMHWTVRWLLRGLPCDPPPILPWTSEGLLGILVSHLIYTRLSR